MIVSINQPAYLPWLGYFHRVACSDLHVVLDHVQFEKNSFINRNKVRTADGWSWLTVPVRTKGKFEQLAITDVEIAPGPWNRKHWQALSTNYGGTSYFSDHAAYFEDLLKRDWRLLLPLLNELTTYLLLSLGIDTPLRHSSEFGSTKRKDELVLDLCLEVGADTYLSGILGRNYLREDMFRARGIEVVYQEYEHPVYSQAFPGFEPYMSVVDVLFNCGPAARDIMMHKRH